jgi:hypothetical protein
MNDNTTTPIEIPQRGGTMALSISFALSVVALILSLYWITMPTESTSESTERLIGMTAITFKRKHKQLAQSIYQFVMRCTRPALLYHYSDSPHLR